jgi:hypothetical protein
MTYLIELTVDEKYYKNFIEYFDPRFDEWEDEDGVEDRVYELLRGESYQDLIDCPYVWVDER